MTKVECSVYDCKHQTGKGCDLKKIELVYSGGRSPYVDVVYCRQYDYESREERRIRLASKNSLHSTKNGKGVAQDQ